MPDQQVSHVLIVGAGWVGRQVAARMAQHGLRVWLCDRQPAIVEQAVDWISQQLNVSRTELTVEACPALEQLNPQQAAAWGIELVLECVSEQLSVKTRVLRQASALLPAPCIVASNSSYFQPSDLAKYVSDRRRFAHLHFHVPVLRESVCDIVGCSETQPHVIRQLQTLAESMGQPPILLQKEHPGYVFNWLLQSVIRSALELTALGVVEPEQVDQSWKAVTGMALGPFGIMDEIGLDLVEQALSNARWASPPDVDDQQLLALLRPLIAAGKLGVKSGAGFYDYPAD